MIALLTTLITLTAVANAAELPNSTVIRAKILNADCSRALIEASASDLKNQCVVIYSGVFTGQATDGSLWSNEVEGNIGFAAESSGVMRFVGKHADLTLNPNTGRIQLVQTPD